MIVLTGAGGFVGSHLLRRLVAEGRTPVRALVREVRGGANAPPGVELVAGDLTRPATLGAALEGASAVVHAAAITADRKEPYRGAYDRANRVGTENLVTAARGAGVERLVVMSGLGTRPSKPGTYMATRWGMEEAVRGCGIPHVILQPSVLFGDGAPFVAALVRLTRRSPVLPVLGGDVAFQPLWIEDLVSCLVRSLGDPAPLGRAIPLGGAERMRFREILSAIRGAMGAHRLLVPVPMPAARLEAALMTALLPRPPLTPAALELFQFDNATGLDSVETSFGFRPRGFLEHLSAHGVEA
ncbi:MAG: SDR family oxidoreductase [Candidatus Dormibacteraceae bacterium]